MMELKINILYPVNKGTTTVQIEEPHKVSIMQPNNNGVSLQNVEVNWPF